MAVFHTSEIMFPFDIIDVIFWQAVCIWFIGYEWQQQQQNRNLKMSTQLSVLYRKQKSFSAFQFQKQTTDFSSALYLRFFQLISLCFYSPLPPVFTTNELRQYCLRRIDFTSRIECLTYLLNAEMNQKRWIKKSAQENEKKTNSRPITDISNS